MLCYQCKEPAGEPKIIEFNYNGFDFSIFKHGLICTDCAKKKHIESFKENGTRLIGKNNDGSVCVNWDIYTDTYCLETCFDEVYAMNKILLSLGIFSKTPSKNWILVIMPEGILANPHGHYFTRKDDIKKFASLWLSNAQHWQIWYIDKTYSASRK